MGFATTAVGIRVVDEATGGWDRTARREHVDGLLRLLHATLRREPARRFREPAPQCHDDECARCADQEEHAPAVDAEHRLAGHAQRQEAQGRNRQEREGVRPCRQPATVCLRQHVGQVGVGDGILGADADAGQEAGRHDQRRCGRDGGQDAAHREPHQVQHERLAPADPVGDAAERGRADEHPEERRRHQQGQRRAAEVVLGLQGGSDRAGQKDLVHLEEQSESDGDDDLAVRAGDGQRVELAADVRPGRDVGGVDGGCRR